MFAMKKKIMIKYAGHDGTCSRWKTISPIAITIIRNSPKINLLLSNVAIKKPPFIIFIIFNYYIHIKVMDSYCQVKY